MPLGNTKFHPLRFKLLCEDLTSGMGINPQVRAEFQHLVIKSSIGENDKTNRLNIEKAFPGVIPDNKNLCRSS